MGLFLFASIAVELTDTPSGRPSILRWRRSCGCSSLIPFPKKKEKDRGDDLYDAFYAPLEEEPLTDEDAMPPALSAEEGSLQLAHVDSLVEKLRGAELDPADRLELDAVVRSLDVYRGKDLTAGQQRALNDCSPPSSSSRQSTACKRRGGLCGIHCRRARPYKRPPRFLARRALFLSYSA